MKKQNKDNQCSYINRVAIHESIKVGGASLGRCENECLPGMTVCYLHATREAMAYAIKLYAKKIKELGGKLY